MITDTERLDALESGFSIWQDIDLTTGDVIWFCQYSIEGVCVGENLREALDKAIIELKKELH